VAVLTWAGLRGGISVALALALPASFWRGDLLLACYPVVLFTIVVQGLTISAFLKAVYGKIRPDQCPSPQADLRPHRCKNDPLYPTGRPAPAPGGQSGQISFVNYFMRLHPPSPHSSL
jgi:hypothetical protein